MTFTHDIFISYGHLDDQDPAGDIKGWVDLLAERLPRVINGFLGYWPKVWRDEHSLQGNDLLRASIEEGLSRSRVFVPIVSPRYVKSEWCRIELNTFCNTRPPIDVPVHRSRIFKVIKTPLLLNLQNNEPEQLRELLGYPFFEMKGDMPDEFSPDGEPNKDRRYWTALRRLAWDISNMLNKLNHMSVAPASPQIVPLLDTSSSISPRASNGSKASKVIYLAETTSDVTHERALVRDELVNRGYEVLPNDKLPIIENAETEKTVQDLLARCVLSVHLIGKRYGSTPEDDSRSIVCIQEQLAAQRCASDPNFFRLFWMPQGLMTDAIPITDERQETYVTQLQNRLNEGSELLQTSVEDLKSRIIEKLHPPQEVTTVASGRSKLKQVYIICETRDRQPVRPIKEFLFKQNLEVITWLDGDSNCTLMDYHRKNLRECDAALVYFGNGDEPWVRKNLEDLEKAYGYGREHDWCASAVYVAAPPNDQKEDFLTHLARYVIRNYNSFDPSDLHDFVNSVRASEGGQR